MRQKNIVMNPPRLWPLTDCTTNYRPVLSSGKASQDEKQSNCLAKEKMKKNLVMGQKRMPDTKKDRPTDRQSQHQLNWTHRQTYGRPSEHQEFRVYHKNGIASLHECRARFDCTLAKSHCYTIVEFPWNEFVCQRKHWTDTRIYKNASAFLSILLSSYLIA
jgi:hypothetical protein